jgi:hypothetical protein
VPGFPCIACLLVRDDHIDLVMNMQIAAERPSARLGHRYTGHSLLRRLCGIRDH